MKINYYALIAFLPILLYSFQGVAIRGKLASIDAKIIKLNEKHIECNHKQCLYTYEYKSTREYLIAGHILRKHKVFSASGNEISPINLIKGNKQDTWINLNVYKTPKNQNIYITVWHPKIAKIGPFAGVYPRETNNREAFSIPDISPTISISTQIISLALLIILFLAAILANQDRKSFLYEDRIYLSIVSFVCLINLAFNSHFFDSIFPSSTFRELLLRGFALTGIGLPILQYIKVKNRNVVFYTSALILLQFTIAYHSKEYFYGYSVYSISITATSIISFLTSFIKKHVYSTIVISFFFLDALRLVGFPIPDHPPIYWSQISLSVFALGVAWRQGARDLIPLAKRAYEHVKRDIEMLKLADHIRRPINSSDNLASVFKTAIKIIPSIATCERVSLLIFLPNENALTLSYARDKNKLKEFNDGKVVGHIFTRCLLYSESFWFETFESLNKSHLSEATPSSNHSDAKYFCALPIKYNNQVLAVLSCTKFNDRKLDGIGSDLTREELRQKITMISREFEAGLSRRLIAGKNLLQERQVNLQDGIKKSILSCDSTEDFLQSICDKISSSSNLRVLLYKRCGINGLLMTHSGLEHHAEKWLEKPLNLDPNSGNKIGPAIVAFNEQKSSYVRDVREIYEHMHPRTVELWEDMQAEEAMTAPLNLGTEQFVILTFSKRGNNPPDSYWLPAFENVRSFLNSAYMLVEQKTSLSALGKLSARLIGDEEIRDKVMSSAIEGEIPTVIGHDVESMIIVFDLEGSTNLGEDGEDKAKAYGTFYDKLTIMCSERISGTVRKTMGDGVIVTAKSPVENNSKFFHQLVSIADDAEKVGISVGGTGTRVALHYGSYFLGLVGTKTSGTPDVIGRNIDIVCKLESKMKNFKGKENSPKISITETAARKLMKNVDLNFFEKDKKIGRFAMFYSTGSFLAHCLNSNEEKREAS